MVSIYNSMHIPKGLPRNWWRSHCLPSGFPCNLCLRDNLPMQFYQIFFFIDFFHSTTSAFFIVNIIISPSVKCLLVPVGALECLKGKFVIHVNSQIRHKRIHVMRDTCISEDKYTLYSALYYMTMMSFFSPNMDNGTQLVPGRIAN